MLPTRQSGFAWRGLMCLLLALSAHPGRAAAQGVAPPTQARDVEAHLSVLSLSPPRLKVEGRRDAGATAWSFRDAYAGMLGLAGRIENLSLADERGEPVPVRRLAAGEYEAARPATAFSYEVRLDPPAATNNAAHVSWLADSHGALLAGDLLPLPLRRARLRLTLPTGWQTAALAVADGDSLVVDDAETAVIFVGRDVRRLRSGLKGSELVIALAGGWAFSDQEAVESVTQIVREHARTFGAAPRERMLVIIAPLPRASAPSQWSAEARGGTVTFLTGRAPTRQSALARLSAPLAHELFHLWVPNALNLTGDYGWFYEGFALYQSLRVGVSLGQLNFNDYLDALARSYDSYRQAGAADDVPLVEASARRWSGSNALIYHKGALAALLYDLDLRLRTGGKRTLDDALRELFRRAGRAAAPRDGNAAVAEALDAVLGDSSFTQRYVRGVRKLDLSEELRPYGLVVRTEGARTRIAVSESLSGRQRALLRQIGYN